MSTYFASLAERLEDGADDQGRGVVEEAAQALREIDWRAACLDGLLAALKEAADYTRHPDYDWPVDFSRQVSALISKATQQTKGNPQ